MSDPSGVLDTKRLVADVASRYGLRIDESDPALAIVILNRLALDNIIEHAGDVMLAQIRAFDASLEKAERRAGNTLAQTVKASCAEIRGELQSDVCAAGLKAQHLVYLVDRAHRSSGRSFVKIRWFILGLLTAFLLSCASFWIGLCFRLH